MEGQKMKQIKYFVMDVDGTLTDGKIYISSDGEAVKAFNIKDGYGIHNILLQLYCPGDHYRAQLKIVVNRCKRLGIKEVHQGVSERCQSCGRLYRNSLLQPISGTISMICLVCTQ